MIDIKQLHRTYIDGCIHNILSLKHLSYLPLEIVYLIIERYWELKSEPVCIILLGSGSDSLHGYSQCTWDLILDQVRFLYPKCRYHVREIIPDVFRIGSDTCAVCHSSQNQTHRYHVQHTSSDFDFVKSQSESNLVDVSESFYKCWDRKDAGCYLISGNKWDRIVNGEKFSMDKEMFKCYIGAPLGFFNLESYLNKITLWVTTTFNNPQFLNHQNPMNV